MPTGNYIFNPPWTTSVYGSGSAYTLTASPALLALGTTTPSLTLTYAGVYDLTAQVRYDYETKTGLEFVSWKSSTRNIHASMQ